MLTISLKRVVVFVMLVVLPVMVIIWEQGVRHHYLQANHSMIRAELHDFLQLLRDREDPETLLSEALFDVLHGIEELNSSTVEALKQRLTNEFPVPPHYVFFDQNMKTLGRYGWQRSEEKGLRDILWDVRWEEEKMASYTNQNFADACQAREALFSGSYRRYDALNHFFQRNLLFRGQRGILVMGSFYDRRFQSNLLHGHYMNTDKDFGGPEAKGSLAFFQPRNLLNNVGWLKERLAKGVSGSEQKVQLVAIDRAQAPDGVSSELWQQIQKRVASEPIGMVEDQSSAVGYLRLDALDDSMLAICTRTWSSDRNAIQEEGSGAERAILFIIGLLYIGALFLIFFVDLEQVVPMSLGVKGVLLLFLAGIMPTIGLVWSFRSLEQWSRLIAVPQGYAIMEQKLARYEKRHEQVLGNCMVEIHRFLENPLWMKPAINQAAITSMTIDMNRTIDRGEGFPIRPNIVHRDLGTVYLASKALGTMDPGADQATVQLIENLIQALQETFGRGLGKSDLSPGNVRASVILDTLQSLLGATSLYRFVLSTDKLVGHRLLGETLWSYLHLMRNENQQVLLTFFFTLERKLIQRRQIYRWVQEIREACLGFEDGHEIPEVGFGTSIQNDFIVLPDHLSRYPVLQQMVRRRGNEGGIQRFRMKMEGREYLLLVRPLRGLEYSGLAFLPIDTAVSHAWRSLAMSALAYPLLLLIAIWILLRYSFLAPVQKLTSGVEAIAAGQFDFRLPPVADDELGQLCLSFNQMAQGLKEKEFMSRFLSDLTLEAVKRGDRALATRTRAAIMFSDIRGFTTLSEGRPGEEIVEMLIDYLTTMEAVIEKHGGSIDKFIGDAIMAVFVPVYGSPDPSLRAVMAAIEMRSALTGFNLNREKEGMFTIRTGIGIASGEVLMGTLGGAGRQDFTVTGGTVNRAAAMEKLSKKATTSFVVVCEETAQRLGASWVKEPVMGDAEPGYVPENGWEITSQRG